jgi:hypothetical protein
MNVIAGQEAKPLADRELEPHELDAVVGGLAVYSVDSPIWKAFLAIEVDDAGFHQSAQLEQMMPITSVAGESRGVETKHRANLSGAQGGHQAIEAGRSTAPLAVRPRSSSITSILVKPRRRATSTNSYWRLWLSRFN